MNSRRKWSRSISFLEVRSLFVFVFVFVTVSSVSSPPSLLLSKMTEKHFRGGWTPKLSAPIRQPFLPSPPPQAPKAKPPAADKAKAPEPVPEPEPVVVPPAKDKLKKAPAEALASGAVNINDRCGNAVLFASRNLFLTFFFPFPFPFSSFLFFLFFFFFFFSFFHSSSILQVQ